MDFSERLDASSLDLDAVTCSLPRAPCADSPCCCDWSQGTDEVKAFVPLAAGTRGRNLQVTITSDR
jgi:hypothetical protein